jgi:hypothetical protein
VQPATAAASHESHHLSTNLSRLHLSDTDLAWWTPDLRSGSEDLCPTILFPVFTFTPAGVSHASD